MDHILDIQNLTTAFKTFDEEFIAVRDISFQISRGEIVGLVGESGCGKSVTCLSVMGLLPRKNSMIKSGSIVFDGVELTALSAKEYAKLRGADIAMVFQEPMTSLNPVFTIYNQLHEAIANHNKKISKADSKAKALHLLKRVGIPGAEHVLKQYPHQLSGGMRQRVMIAMALANEPKFLIADEPTTALDVTIQAQILDMLKRLAAEEGLTVLLVTHDLGVVAEMCDRVCVMYGGRFVEDASRNEFYKHPRHPYSQGLLDCIPEIGMSGKTLSSIPGNAISPAEEQPGCSFAQRCSVAMEKCFHALPPLYSLGQDHYCRCWLVEEEGEQL